MSDGPTFISDVLPEHVRFVRAVARSLLDEHEAEDAVQDTLLRAIEQPPEPGNLRGWLRVVVRNFALRRLREERRRKHREMLQGPPGHISSPEESLQRIEGQRRVLDAVRELPEPYRSAIVHHYLDELTREQMAARLGIPIETVRTRLKRALKMLREKLDQGEGGTNAWVAALAPLLIGTRPAPPAGGAGAASLALLAAKVVVAVAIIGSGTLLLASRTVSSAPARSAAEAPPAIHAADVAPAPTSTAADGGALFVSCVVRDALGAPLAGARAAASWGESETGLDGAFRLPASPIDGRTSVVVWKEGYLPWRGVLDPLPGEEHSITLLRGAPLTVVVRTRDGAPVAGARVIAFDREERGIAGLWWSRRIVSVADGVSGVGGRASLGVAPEGRIEIRVDDPRYAACREEVVVLGTEAVLVECVLSCGGEISGRVTDGAGRPVARARVYSSAFPDRVAVTAADGTYRLPLVEEGENRILAEADGFGTGFFGASLGWGRPVPVQVRAGRETRDVDIALPAAIEVSGRVIDEEGRALAGVRVEGLAGPCAGRPVRARTDGSGAFAIGPFARTDGRGIRLTLALEGYVIDPVAPGLPPQAGAPLDVGEIRARALGGLRGRVLDVDGQPLREGRVEMLPRGPAALVGADGTFALSGVPAGAARIRVTAWDPPRGATESITVEADGATETEIRLGPALPIRGRVLSPGGKPRPGVAVAALAEGSANEIAARTTTDAKGGFDLGELPQGAYRVGLLRTPFEQETAPPNTAVEFTDDAVAVHIVVPGLESEAARVEPVLLPEPTPQRAIAGTDDLTFLLRGYGTRVEGSVVSATTGLPLRSFEVSFIGYWKGVIPRSSETVDVRDGAGRFSYELDEGDWAVEITAPGHASVRTPVFRAGLKASWDAGTIRLSAGGSLRGAVRDAAGEPVSYARLYLLGPQMQTNRRPIFTDAEGGYDASCVTPGAYTIFVLSPRHPFGIVRNVRIAEDETSPLDVRLARPSPVTVRVTDEDGQPVAGADVSYTCDALFPLTSRLLRSHEPPGWGGYLTDAEGRIRKEFLPAGRVLFTAEAPGFAKAKRFAELSEDVETLVEIRLAKLP